jgi:hypothetical protein
VNSVLYLQLSDIAKIYFYTMLDGRLHIYFYRCKKFIVYLHLNKGNTNCTIIVITYILSSIADGVILSILEL